MEKKKDPGKPEPGPRKKRIFSIIVFLIPLVFIIILEIFLRILGYGGDTRLFISGTDDISNYWMCNPKVARRYFFMQETIPTPSKDLFLKEKPENGYRIFVLGGSTTAGFPYGNNIMFSRILNRRLSDTFPNKYIEIINTAMSAINSYTLVDLVDEILDKQPDVIIIYAGHNEYYGALGVASMESLGRIPWVVHTYLNLKKYKIFVLVRDIVGSIRKAVGKTFYDSTKEDPTATLMARIVAEQKIPYQSEMYELGKKQFQNNLTVIFRKAEKANVPVLVSELVSNIRDQAPFESVKIDSFPTAERAYQVARALDRQKDYADAQIAYSLAKDLDALRFRASEEFNDIIRQTAEKFKMPVVPMKSVFEKQSPDGLMGNNLFVEHLHPNVDGHFLLADAFYRELLNNKFISPDPDSNLIKTSSCYREGWSFTPLDSASAALGILYLKGGWPFKPKTRPNHSLDNFTVKTIIDSLALRVLVDKSYSLESAHLHLAEFYETRNQYNNALNEYMALIYTIPWEMMFYERAARLLIKMNQTDRALGILLESFKYGSTAFTNKWTGQLLIAQGFIQDAVPYLEKAYALTPDDKQLENNLIKAGDFLQKTIGEHAEPKQSRIDPQQVPQNNSGELKITSNTVLLQNSIALVKAKNYNKALPLLKKSLKIEDTFEARKWLGLVYLATGKFKESIVNLEKADNMNPDNFEVLYNLAHAYILLKQKLPAKNIIQRMEKLRPDFYDPQKIRSKLDELK
ncbi:tetratricopeptide repeat protein [candidate division KSB1 bacterium]|nr:tetratricopeptide repeat protein [candidate division KSB1 bacterium]